MTDFEHEDILQTIPRKACEVIKASVIPEEMIPEFVKPIRRSMDFGILGLGATTSESALNIEFIKFDDENESSTIMLSFRDDHQYVHHFIRTVSQLLQFEKGLTKEVILMLDEIKMGNVSSRGGLTLNDIDIDYRELRDRLLERLYFLSSNTKFAVRYGTAVGLIKYGYERN